MSFNNMGSALDNSRDCALAGNNMDHTLGNNKGHTLDNKAAGLQ